MKQFLYLKQGRNLHSFWINRPEAMQIADDSGLYSCRPNSITFICPWCCDQWARLTETLGNEAIDTKYHYLAPVSCTACWKPDYRAPVPGSILHNAVTWALGWHLCADPELVRSLPDELVKREFQLLLRAYAS